jgi:penicillin-binding protein 2
LFLSILALVGARFFYLQIIKGSELKELREQNINAFEYIYPKRGRILSRDGVVLAEDRKIFSLATDLDQKPSEVSIEILSNLFPEKIKLEDLKEKVSNSLTYRRSEVILEKITQEDLAKYLVRGSDLRGFSVIEGYEREYNDHPSIFHVLGHMGYINSTDVRYFSPRIDNYDAKLWRKSWKIRHRTSLRK